MSYTSNRFLGNALPATPPEVVLTRSPWAILGMFGLLTGMAVYFSKEMDRKKLSKNGRSRRR